VTSVSARVGNNCRSVELKSDTYLSPWTCGLFINMAVVDTAGTAGKGLVISEYVPTPYAAHHWQALAAPVANITFERLAIVQLRARRFAIREEASGAGSVSFDLYLQGLIEVAP
jgi:hypothetical protein